MKISRLYVKGFGKIEDFSITLSNGLNVIYGPNESGKSTLMAFIRAMLYGIKGGRTSKDGRVAETKHYLPWSNAPYGGYLNFELDNGSTYRIDRSFDSGVVKLYDSSFNDITSSFVDGKDDSAIAEKLIGLNGSLFERTVYIKQMGTRIDTSASKDLIDRISNIKQSGQEDISYKKANAALKEALKQQVGTDRSYTRPLDIINKRLLELNTTKIRIQEEDSCLLEVRIKQEELAMKINKLIAKENLFAKLIEFCKLKEKLRLQKDKDEEIRFLNDGIKQAQKNINTMSTNKVALEIELDSNSKSALLLSEQQGCDQNGLQEKLEKQRFWRSAFDMGGILSLIVLMGVSAGAFVFDAIGIEYALVPVLMTLIFILLRFKSNSMLKGLEEAQKERYARSEELKNEYTKAQRIGQILQKQIESVKDQIAIEKVQHEQLIIRLENQNIHYKQFDIAILEKQIDAVSEEISELRIDKKLDMNETEKELCDNILEDNSESQYITIMQRKDFVTAQIQQKRLENAALEANMKKRENSQSGELVEAEIAGLTQQKRLLEQRGEALSIAIKTLEESTNNVQKKYIPIMNKVFKDTFSGLTDKKYSDIRAGDDLSIMLSDPSSERVVPVSMLSSGTIDQMYLALRIAISETVLKSKEGLPFIMDEPFAQYDDERTDNALGCIYAISKKQQVIIFTCKQREVDLISSRYPCKICSLT